MYCPNPDCPDRDGGRPPGEYRDDVQSCPVCDTALVRELPAAAPGEPPDDPAPDESGHPASENDVAVLTTGNLVEADMAAAALEDAGIPHYRQRRGLSGLLLGGGVAPAPGQVHVLLVPGAAAPAAREALEGLFVEVDEPFDDDEEELERPYVDPTPVTPGTGGTVIALILAALAALVLFGLVMG